MGAAGAVSVHRDAIEALADRFPQRAGQQRGSDAGVRREDAEHRGHVGGDHARALGHPAHTRGPPAEGEVDDHLLRARVRGHDRAGGDGAAFPGQLRGRARDSAAEGGHGEGDADDARRAHHHVGGPAADFLRDQVRRLARVAEAGLAGGRVGTARVDDHGTGLAAGEMLARDQDGRGLGAIAREHARGRAGPVGHHEGEVEPLRLDPAGHGGRSEAAGSGDAARRARRR